MLIEKPMRQQNKSMRQSGKNQGQSDKNRLNRQLRPAFGIQFLDAIVGSDGSEAAVDRHLQLAGIGMCLSVAEGMLDALCIDKIVERGETLTKDDG